ncbi:hypothetical protein HanRHA438_Chr15g0715801 [Helianthus annuus]|nr:hypothetical protein HanIR_Chr15g0765101 [Helianthus annuus]KAJ0845625.1 hypothetical protein HanRHA438_Chr15g0715801 [Helianthus annuus]
MSHIVVPMCPHWRSIGERWCLAIHHLRVHIRLLLIHHHHPLHVLLLLILLLILLLVIVRVTMIHPLTTVCHLCHWHLTHWITTHLPHWVVSHLRHHWITTHLTNIAATIATIASIVAHISPTTSFFRLAKVEKLILLIATKFTLVVMFSSSFLVPTATIPTFLAALRIRHTLLLFTTTKNSKKATKSTTTAATAFTLFTTVFVTTTATLFPTISFFSITISTLPFHLYRQFKPSTWSILTIHHSHWPIGPISTHPWWTCHHLIGLFVIIPIRTIIIKFIIKLIIIIIKIILIFESTATTTTAAANRQIKLD